MSLDSTTPPTPALSAASSLGLSPDAAAALAASLATPPLPGTVESAPAGVKGFDVDTPLSPDAARAFRDQGYHFCVRYVGRTAMKPGRDLTADEARTILDAGLALMIVQHVLAPGWLPTRDLGAEYGANAARFTSQLGVPAGVSVWCDLEGVSEDAAADDVIAFCNAWHDEVARAGYVPGLYVGDAPGLSAKQLFDELAFRHYWGAYNVNADQEPLPRGWQLKQRVGTSGSVAGITTETYDDDVTRTDQLGGQALWLTTSLLG
jgi:hypothetical protein